MSDLKNNDPLVGTRWGEVGWAIRRCRRRNERRSAGEVGYYFAQERSVPGGESPRSVHPDNVFVVVANRHDCPRPVPSRRVVAGLVLDSAYVANHQMRQHLGAGV